MIFYLIHYLEKGLGFIDIGIVNFWFDSVGLLKSPTVLAVDPDLNIFDGL